MIIVIAAILIVMFFGCRFRMKNDFADEMLSLPQVNMIKGLCALEIVMDHLGAYIPDNKLLSPFHTVGLLAVAMFFFFSGYGVTKSRLGKPEYLRKFLPNRLSSVLIPLFVTNLFYLALNFLLGTNYTFGESLLKVFDFSGYSAALNGTTWYIYTIAYFYIIFYIGYRFLSERLALVLLTAFALVYSLIPVIIGGDQLGVQRFGMCFCFIAGTITASNEKKLIASMRRHYLLWLAAAFLATGLGLILYLKKYEDLFWGGFIGRNIGTFCFTFLMLLILMKVRPSNRVLAYLGKISIEIYLLHMVFIRLYRSDLMNLKDDAIYSAAVIISSIALASLIHFPDQWLVAKAKHGINRMYTKRT